MFIDLITLFPGLLRGAFSESIVERAIRKGLLRIRLLALRDFAGERHGKVDDRPYGGGPGMVLRAEPVLRAVRSARRGRPSESVFLLSPQGRAMDQSMARCLATRDHLVFVCGHYAGVDERVKACEEIREISLGDFVLSGGESAVIPIVDAVARLLPGVLGDSESPSQDSFWEGILGPPLYTRPPTLEKAPVPEVLFSGHHQRIASWRREQSLRRTIQKRPDLLEKVQLSKTDRELVENSSEDVS